MSDLLGAQPAQPADPRIHVCARCGKPGAPCGIAGQWFCAPCAPADFWPDNGGQS